jgi:tetratricopeptide (TPR) repeat protein
MRSNSRHASTPDRRPWLQFLVAVALLFALFIPEAAAQQTAANFAELAAAASAARERNDIPRAIQLYTEAERLKPDWPDGWWFLALLFYSGRSYSAARDAFSRYLDLKLQGAGASAQAFALRGLCEFEIGEYPQSLADIERGIGLGATDDPGNETILRFREALLLTRLERFEEALKLYGSIATARPNDSTIPAFKLGVGLAGLRSPQLPADVPSDQREPFESAGNAALLLMEGEVTEGKQAFATLFQHFPNLRNAHYLCGFLLLPTDPDATIAEYKRELEVAPANVTAAAMLAWVLQQQGDPAQALPYAQKAVAEEPSLAVAQLVLGRSLAETENLSGGIEHLETALRLQPGYLETHVALATAYARFGREEDARRERLQSLRMAQVSSAKP